MIQRTLKNPFSHLYAALTGGAIGGVLFGLLRLPTLVAVIGGIASYLVSLFLLFPARTRSALQPVAAETAGQKQASWTQRHLALLVFLGTLIGSLLGALGSLSEIVNGLFVPAWKTLHPAPLIRVVGSDTILGQYLGMAAQWTQEFQKATQWEETVPMIGKIERVHDVQIDAIGSLKGIQEAQRSAGKVHVLATSEPLLEKDALALSANGTTIACAGEIGYDVIVFVTNKDTEAPTLSVAQLTAILTGQVRDWSAVGATRDTRKTLPITIFARQGSGTTDVVMAGLTDSHDFPAHLTECSSNADCLNQTLATPGSLYWVSLSWLYKQPFDYMQIIQLQPDVDNVLPTDPADESFDPDHYPTLLVRPLYLYVLQHAHIPSQTVTVARSFFHYVRGVHGQKILEQQHFYTYFSPPADMHLTLPRGFGRQPDGTRVVCQ